VSFDEGWKRGEGGVEAPGARADGEKGMEGAAGLLQVKEVSFEYRNGARCVTALQSVSLQADEADFVCVLGPSGCGKSTLLRIIAGLLQPTSGLVLVRGKPVKGPDAGRGIVLQQPTLYPWLTVYENVAFGLRLRRTNRDRVERIVRYYLERMGLWEFRGLRPYELSGGMQQRVALARALATDPEIILMDEPLGALDALTRERMQELILEIWRESRKTILFVTHSVEEAILLATKVVVMSARPGRILAEREVPFSRRCAGVSGRAIRGDRDFVKLREELTEMIWEAV
jgi:taurine transport system ATP-binding protein